LRGDKMLITKFFGKIIKFVLPWEAILGFIIELAANLLRDWLKQESFTKKAKYFTMGIYVLVEGIGEELANDTNTTVDNKVVGEVITSCKEAANTHGFKLPEVENLK